MGFPERKKGGKRMCDRCGAEYYINENKLFKQEGLWLDRECYDSLTDKEREERIKH